MNNRTAWTEELIKLHKSINWAERNYEPYQVEGTEIRLPATLIASNGSVATVYTTFVLTLSANTIFELCYESKEFQPFEGYLSGCYDGTKIGNTKVMDRFETPEVYDMLSR